jgi:cation diffusion facilitator family transporter
MSSGGANPVKAILYAFWANLGIATAKLVAAIVTGSSSMLAEAIHSGADTGNQLLLLLGLRRSKKPATAEHPLGFGKATFFWSFIVAIMLFSLGGLFSIYEGLHKLEHQGPVEHAWVALLVLGVSIALEAGSLFGCLREINALRGERGLWRWLHESRNAELIVVFGEDLGALLGLALALAFLSLAALTGDSSYDAYGSMSIGAVLLVIAAFVSVRVHALLIGRSADPELSAAIEALIAETDSIESVYRVITIQLGPEVLLAAKVRMQADVSIGEACLQINDLERRLKERFPALRWSFIEPDIAD